MIGTVPGSSGTAPPDLAQPGRARDRAGSAEFAQLLAPSMVAKVNVSPGFAAPAAPAALLASFPAEFAQEPTQAITDPMRIAIMPPNPLQRQAALVFNENGFFESSGRVAQPDAEPARRAAADLERPRTESPVSARDGEFEKRELSVSAYSTRVVAALRPDVTPKPNAAMALHAQGAAIDARLLPGAHVPLHSRAVRLHAIGEPASAARGRREFREGATAREVAEVRLRQTEEGVEVIAHTGTLGHFDRMRLRDAIAELLSRHGMGARTIRIHARRADATSEDTP